MLAAIVPSAVSVKHWIAPKLPVVVSPSVANTEPPDENSSVLFRELAMLGIISQGYRLSGLPIYVSSESFVKGIII